MSPGEEEVRNTWMNDESGEIDLCQFCLFDKIPQSAANASK